MNDNKFQLEKRLKWVHVSLFAGVLLILLLLGQLIYYFGENFKTFMNGLQLILWTIFTVSNWFQFKQIKLQLQELSSSKEI